MLDDFTEEHEDALVTGPPGLGHVVSDHDDGEAAFEVGDEVFDSLNACGIDHQSPEIRKAVDWLVSIQNPDGGWGEDGSSYKLDYHGHEGVASTSSQTAWAILGLMACGEVDHPAVARGVQYLVRTQTDSGLWDEERFTATGFPRVFYLRYHGYRRFFPLWALARYRNLKESNSAKVSFGM